MVNARVDGADITRRGCASARSVPHVQPILGANVNDTVFLTGRWSKSVLIAHGGSRRVGRYTARGGRSLVR